MRIEQITAQHRRDFSAILICEHCDSEQELNGGYDDANYHQNVIPAIKCRACGETSPKDYRPVATKYPEWFTV